MSIDLLEHGGGDFLLIHHGEPVEMPDPSEHHFQWVLMCLHMQHVPGTPGDMPDWVRLAVFDRWRIAWDLPLFEDARRLTYLADHYRGPLTADLLTHAGLDLGDMWRARRWQTLLDVLDRLPGHSWFSAAIANDEDHAAMMYDSIMARPNRTNESMNKDSKGPDLTTFTPEVAALTNVLDAVRHVGYTVAAVQAGAKAGDPPPPAPRPTTALERAMKRADHDRRKQRHDALAARMLPHKSQGAPPVH